MKDEEGLEVLRRMLKDQMLFFSFTSSSSAFAKSASVAASLTGSPPLVKITLSTNEYFFNTMSHLVDCWTMGALRGSLAARTERAENRAATRRLGDKGYERKRAYRTDLRRSSREGFCSLLTVGHSHSRSLFTPRKRKGLRWRGAAFSSVLVLVCFLLGLFITFFLSPSSLVEMRGVSIKTFSVSATAQGGSGI